MYYLESSNRERQIHSRQMDTTGNEFRYRFGAATLLQKCKDFNENKKLLSVYFYRFYHQRRRFSRFHSTSTPTGVQSQLLLHFQSDSTLPRNIPKRLWKRSPGGLRRVGPLPRSLSWSSLLCDLIILLRRSWSAS